MRESGKADGRSPMTLSRRGFFAGLGAAGAASVFTAATASGTATATEQDNADLAASKKTVDFDGPHQAGIRTAPQSYALLIAYDFKDGEENKQNMERLMRIWTKDARSMTQGEPALADLEGELSKTPDNLTITVGWGPTLIDKLKLSSKVPAWVSEHRDGLPAFKGDKLDDAWGQADLCLQICGNDLTAVNHAARVLTRGGQDYVTPVWSQRGFLDAVPGQTPRNLLGFKDGTAVPRTDDQYNEEIWDDQGGSAMVVRRIVYDMPAWEALDRQGRETVFGRKADTGAPLSGKGEFDKVDLNKTDDTGIPLIDKNSHVGIAAGEGTRLRRRAYNFDDAVTPKAESGLIFICFQKDPSTAFTPLQKRLAASDRLNRWITHVGSAVFWNPPGTQQGSYWGQKLLEG